MSVQLVALALSSATMPQETDWWYVTLSSDVGELNAHYADRASIRRSGDRVIVAEAREHEATDDLGIRSSGTAAEYDCRARSGRIVSGTFFAADGSVVAQEESEEDLMPVAANTVADTMLRFACGEEGGLEQLGELEVREQSLLLFRDYAEHLRENQDSD